MERISGSWDPDLIRPRIFPPLKITSRQPHPTTRPITPFLRAGGVDLRGEARSATTGDLWRWVFSRPGREPGRIRAISGPVPPPAGGYAAEAYRPEVMRWRQCTGYKAVSRGAREGRHDGIVYTQRRRRGRTRGDGQILTFCRILQKVNRSTPARRSMFPPLKGRVQRPDSCTRAMVSCDTPAILASSFLVSTGSADFCGTAPPLLF